MDTRSLNNTEDIWGKKSLDLQLYFSQSEGQHGQEWRKTQKARPKQAKLL